MWNLGALRKEWKSCQLLLLRGSELIAPAPGGSCFPLFFPRTCSKPQGALQTPPDAAWASLALLLPHSPWLFVFSSAGEPESWLRNEHHIKKVHMKPIQFFPRTLHARIQPQTVIPINMHIPAFPITKSERLGLSALQEISSPHCPLLSATH